MNTVNLPRAAVSILKVIGQAICPTSESRLCATLLLPSERRSHPPSAVIRLTSRYNQKPFIGLIGAGQMYDVCAVPPAAGETLEIFWMRRYHHNVGSHVKLPAGRARNPLTHIHV